MDDDITLVRAFFNRATAACDQARTFAQKDGSAPDIGEQVLLAHIMAVAGVETFFNTYLFTLSLDGPFEQDMRDDLEQRLPLEAKLRRWPNRLFDENMILDRGACRDFLEGKERRNALMHYHPETRDPYAVPIERLTAEMAEQVLTGAIAVIDQLLFLQGLNEQQARQICRTWTGLELKPDL